MHRLPRARRHLSHRRHTPQDLRRSIVPLSHQHAESEQGARAGGYHRVDRGGADEAGDAGADDGYVDGWAGGGRVSA